MKISRTATVFIFAAVFCLFLALFLFKVQYKMADFEVNYKAGNRILMGETLYRTVDEHWQFKYSPFCALLYLPLSLLPLPVAKGAWFFIVLGSCGFLLGGSWRLIDSGRKKVVLLLALPALILVRFLLREIELGQVNALITAILLGMTWLLWRDETHPSNQKKIFAGMLGGLAAAMKPYALIFWPYYILKKKWLTLLSAALFLAVSIILPAAFFGFSGNWTVHGEWLSSLSGSTPHLLSSQDNVSLLACFVKWLGNEKLSLTLYAAAGILAAFLVLLFIRKGKHQARNLLADSALLLLLIPLLSPLGWDYTFLSSCLAVTLILYYFPEFSKAGRIILIADFLFIGLSFYDLLGRRAYATFMNLSVLTVNFLVLAGYLFYLRIKGRA
jgi:hypothetical protein